MEWSAHPFNAYMINLKLNFLFGQLENNFTYYTLFILIIVALADTHSM